VLESSRHPGYEVMAMMRKGQVRKIGSLDVQAQAAVIAELFDRRLNTLRY
jgi:hypothetical protein